MRVDGLGNSFGHSEKKNPKAPLGDQNPVDQPIAGRPIDLYQVKEVNNGLEVVTAA
jgi:hypothetical protein